VHKGRLEAFSDGVLAIILTIMVLEIKVPHGGELADLAPVCPVFIGYALSFIYVGIYWNNHHHLFHATRKIDGRVMWANLHLLFWLSLVPVLTGWVGENHSSAWPTALYGWMLFMASIAWLILERMIIAVNGQGSELAQAVGNETKGKASALLYAVAIGMAFVAPWVSQLLYAAVAGMWLVPDRRIEKTLTPEP
jgi:uncharacterized membrane protein